MNRTQLLVFGALLLLAILLVGSSLLLLWLHSSSSTPPSNQAKVAVTASTTSTPLFSRDVTRLEKALGSPDMHTQATALMPDLATTYLQQGQPLIPAGATIRLLPNTELCEATSCKVDAVVTEKSGKETTFTLYLDDSTGQWLVAGTNQK